MAWQCSTGMSADITLVFRSVIVPFNCYRMAVNCFKQALHLHVTVTQSKNIVSVSEVKNVEFRNNLNPWAALLRIKSVIMLGVQYASQMPKTFAAISIKLMPL